VINGLSNGAVSHALSDLEGLSLLLSFSSAISRTVVQRISTDKMA